MTEIPFAKVRDWMFRDALPFWAAHGVDRENGGFLEDLNPDGSPTATPFKRVRVTARQTYVFSHAALLGWSEGERLSRLGYEFLLSNCRLPDGGYAKTLTRSGDVLDPTIDLYDMAFVLFAFAWRYRVSRDAEALNHAHATLDFIQNHMRAPNGGFFSALPRGGVLQQNPHMHLTEACLAAFEASGDQRFLDQASELIALLRTRLFDGRTLGERFSEHWVREANDALEPGHHFEWPWILAQHQRLSGADNASDAAALLAFGETYGVDPSSQAVFDAVREDGTPLRRSSRAWTNTERIKGWLGLFEMSGRDPRVQVRRSLELLFNRYFANSLPGAWVDQFDGDGAPMVQAVPASIVYHLFLAFSEVLRLEPKLSALPQSPA